MASQKSEGRRPAHLARLRDAFSTLPLAAIAHFSAIGSNGLIIAVVGARSRSATAFLNFIRRNAPQIGCRSFSRGRPGGAGPDSGDAHIEVAGYDQIDASALAGCDAIINFVGVTSASDQGELHHINVEIAEYLARQADKAGIAHFVQMSSLAVHGNQTWIDQDSPLAPAGEYGRSKLSAENAISAAASATLALTFLRVPAIYGPEAPSKLGVLVKALRALPLFPVPTPLPSRSVISHANLSRVLLSTVERRITGIVYAADPQPFDLALLAKVLPRAAKLVRMPAGLLKPVSWIAPGIWNSLYSSSVIVPDILDASVDLLPTEVALADAFAADT